MRDRASNGFVAGLAVTAVLLIGGGTMAVAGASSPPGVVHGVIHACIERGTVPDSPVGPDNLEFHLRNGKCPAGWMPLSWNRRGPRGPKGHRGNKGRRGMTGRRGPHGPQGEVGAKGKTGATGATGPAGAAGANGATGPQGPPGPTAGVGGGNGLNPPATEGKVLDSTQITTTTAGKLYVEANEPGIDPCVGSCTTVSNAGLYVDGTPVPHTLFDFGNFGCSEGCQPVYISGVLSNVVAGTHTIDFAVTAAAPANVSSSQGQVNAILLGNAGG